MRIEIPFVTNNGQANEPIQWIITPWDIISMSNKYVSIAFGERNSMENIQRNKTSIVYNKLVRDRIPAIIESSGKFCITEILSKEDYLRMVDAKLDEELAEYHKDQNIEELADLMEVIYAATLARGYTLEQLEQVRKDKAAKRGGFTKKILLKEVIERE